MSQNSARGKRQPPPSDLRCDYLTTRKNRCTHKVVRDHRCNLHLDKPVTWSVADAELYGVARPDLTPAPACCPTPCPPPDVDVPKELPPQMDTAAKVPAPAVAAVPVETLQDPPKQLYTEKLECPVCYDNNAVPLLTCIHALCKSCYHKTERRMCPLCRKPLADFDEERDRQKCNEILDIPPDAADLNDEIEMLVRELVSIILRAGPRAASQGSSRGGHIIFFRM